MVYIDHISTYAMYLKILYQYRQYLIYILIQTMIELWIHVKQVEVME